MSVCACIHRTVSFLFTFSPILRFFNRTSEPRMKRGGRRRAETKCEKEWIGFRCVCFIIFPTSFDQTVHLPFSHLWLLVFFSAGRLKSSTILAETDGDDEGEARRRGKAAITMLRELTAFFCMLHIFLCNSLQIGCNVNLNIYFPRSWLPACAAALLFISKSMLKLLYHVFRPAR